MDQSLPIIDVAGLRGSAEERRDLGSRFVQTYGEVGFGYVINHGVPQALVDSVFDQSRRFHGLSLEQKMAVALDENHRGFIPINTSTDVTSTLATVTKANQSESFMMMREAGGNDPDVMAGAYLAGPNRWPSALQGFQETLASYDAAMCALAHSIVKVIAVALGDERGQLIAEFERPTTWLRLLHYPPQVPASPDDLYGSAPHTDFGCITLLAQDHVGGLEVRTMDGEWVTAPPIEGSFGMTVGDMLHRWSNGRLASTPHRVINRSGRERYSVPFFYDPNVSADIAPLLSTIAAEHPVAFETLNFGEFLRSQLTASYVRHAPPQGKQAANSAR